MSTIWSRISNFWRWSSGHTWLHTFGKEFYCAVRGFSFVKFHKKEWRYIRPIIKLILIFWFHYSFVFFLLAKVNRYLRKKITSKFSIVAPSTSNKSGFNGFKTLQHFIHSFFKTHFITNSNCRTSNFKNLSFLFPSVED